jgi:hypothetical protein
MKKKLSLIISGGLTKKKLFRGHIELVVRISSVKKLKALFILF